MTEILPPPYYTAEEIAAFRAIPATWRDEFTPLARMMCANCQRHYAVEGDVGDEQGGPMWFGPCCPTPPRYADVFIREATRRMEGCPDHCRCYLTYPPGSGPAARGSLVPCHLHRKEAG